MTFARKLTERREQREAERERNLQALCTPSRALTKGSYAGGVSGQAVEKEPADRNPNLRRLAEHEECTLRLSGCRCHPLTTVWAHTNTQRDRKGMGYKAHDSRGFFAGHECHLRIDQGKEFGRAEREQAVFYAQMRTISRLYEIAESATEKPWRKAAAQWALDQFSNEEGTT